MAHPQLTTSFAAKLDKIVAAYEQANALAELEYTGFKRSFEQLFGRPPQLPTHLTTASATATPSAFRATGPATTALAARLQS